MATYYAIGASSADLSTLANWKTARDGSGSSPGSFDATDTYYIEQAPSSAPTSAWTGNLNDEVLNVIITYGGAIGAAGNPVRFAIASGGCLTIDRGGSATQYLAPVGTSANQVWTKCRVNRTGTGKMVFNHSSAVQCNDLAVSSGCNVECGDNFQLLASTGVIRTEYGSTVTLAGTNTIPIGYFEGSVPDCSRPGTLLWVLPGGYLKTTGSGSAQAAVKVARGGKWVHHAAGTVTDSEVFPGGEATTRGSVYTPTVTTRRTWAGGKNFEDSAVIVGASTEDPITPSK